MDLPIICTLTERELRQRRKEILDWVRTAAIAAAPLPNGYVYTFAPADDILPALTRLVALEHQCCRFLNFKIVVPAGDQPITLEVTGEGDAGKLIADFFGGTDLAGT
jgi:hypothetical protein